MEEPFKINHKIQAREVRLVGENVEQGIYPIDQARRMAQEQQLDLVEISPTAVPPVCRIIDYSKFKYEQKKKTRELKAKTTKVVVKEIRFGPNTDDHDYEFKLKAKTTKVVVKEIRFGPNTDDHDYEFKLKHAREFLKEGAKIKAYVHFVGRSIVFKERGEILLLKFAQALEDLAKVEQLPKLEGKRMFLFLAPKVSAKQGTGGTPPKPKPAEGAPAPAPKPAANE